MLPLKLSAPEARALDAYLGVLLFPFSLLSSLARIFLFDCFGDSIPIWAFRQALLELYIKG